MSKTWKTIRITPATHEKLKAVSDREGVSMSDIIRSIQGDYLRGLIPNPPKRPTKTVEFRYAAGREDTTRFDKALAKARKNNTTLTRVVEYAIDELL